MQPEILVTGGTGKTGRRIAARLRAAGYAPRVASRNPGASDEVRFDWGDPATFSPAFQDVGALYLVAPTNDQAPLEAMRAGLDRALASGVERFVLLSASSLDEGGPMMGAVHAYLHEQAPQWVVLRPTWFMQNLSEQQHLPTIRDERVIYSATGDGRVPFIDAEDIAAVGTAALTDRGMPSGDLILTGPEALSYDEVARRLSAVVGEPVVHRRLSGAEMAGRFRRFGLQAGYAEALAAMDSAIAAGAEDRVTDVVERITGRPPKSLAQFAQENRSVWL